MIDEERYLNDPVYRHQIMAEKKAKASASKPSNDSKKKGDPFWRYVGITIGVILLLNLMFLAYLMQGLPTFEELENPRTDNASLILSRDGVALDRFFTENRTVVRFANISPHVVNALVSTEDHRFYDHWGIDMIRTLAVPYHILRGNMQGGSTITQQLARNLYRKIGKEVSVIRKLREMITAIQLERSYTKQEIIEMYLNTVEFSNSAFGIESASRTHYNKAASQLNINEAATMVGSLNAIFAYNPRLRPETSTRRRNTVLSRMYTRGHITLEQYEEEVAKPIELDYQPPNVASRKVRYFGEYVRQNIQDWVERNGYDLYRDGLKIYTTVDSRMQRIAEAAVQSQLDTLQVTFQREWTSRGGSYMNKLWNEYPGFLDSFIRESEEFKTAVAGGSSREHVMDSLKAIPAYVDAIKRSRTRLEASFLAIDPRDGHILAYVGGSNYSKYQFDQVTMSRRQAGSTFKPFVYAVAIDNGYKPDFMVSRYPTSFVDRGGKVWNPRDASSSSGPEMISLREALARSNNNVTVRLLPILAGVPGTNKLEELQPAARKIVDMAKNMGIHSPMQVVPAVALGTAEVSLMELTGAYATFANQGVHIEPIGVTRIEDRNGNVLIEFYPESRQEVISAETAYTLIDMMRGAIRGGDWGYGTGARLRGMGVYQDVAGKTGTTNDSADNWFMAVMPHIAMGSWVGGEDRRIRFPSDTYIGQGARAALPIVGKFIMGCINSEDCPWSMEGFEPPMGYVLEAEETETATPRRGRTGW
jgi:penicillin-binding protein 1A